MYDYDLKSGEVVNGPEILNRFVGASEEKIRELFEEARADQAENGDDADLHIIIFDEIDSICKVTAKNIQCDYNRFLIWVSHMFQAL